MAVPVRNRPLSAAQLRMMRGIREMGEPTAYVRGLSAHGGAYWTLQSLLKRGLVVLGDGFDEHGRSPARLTEAGDAAFDAATGGRYTR